MKKSVRSSKQVLAVFLAVLLSVLSVLLPSEVPESDIIIQASATEDMNNVFQQFNLNLNTYMADVITNVDSSKYNQLQFRLIGDSPAGVLAAAFNNNSSFLGNVAEWKTGTFSASDTANEQISEVDYYESIILSSLKSYTETSFISDTLDNKYVEYKELTFEIAKDILQTTYDLDLSKGMTNQQVIQLGKDKVGKAVKDSFEEAFPGIDKVSDIMDYFNLLVDAGKSLEQSIDNLVAYINCVQMNNGMKQVVADMYNKCGDNSALKQALFKVKSACQSYAMAFDVAAFDVSGRLCSVVYGFCMDTLISTAIEGTPLVYLLMGQQIGKGIANFLFSTDDTVEQYFKLNAFVEIEKLIKNVTKEYVSNYQKNPTETNAENLLAAIDILYTNYDVSCDTAQEMADIVFQDNVWSQIVNAVFPHNDEGYNNFTSQIQSMKNMNAGEYQNIRSIESYRFMLEEDYPEIYRLIWGDSDSEEYVEVESIQFKQSSVEWGLEDNWLINDDIIINPPNATCQEIVYTSSDPSVVTYDVFGFKVHKTGTAVITAKAVSNGMTANLNVTVVAGNGKDGLKLEDANPTAEIRIGETFQNGLLTYRVISQNTVQVCSCDETAKSICIPIATQIINQTNKKQTILHNRKRKFF